MTSTDSVYYGTAAGQQLRLAAAEIDRHATSSTDGRCAVCDLPGPCPRRETAVAIFSRYLLAAQLEPPGWPAESPEWPTPPGDAAVTA